MKLFTLMSLLTVSSLSYAQNMTLNCKASQNYESMFESVVTLSPNQKNVAVGSVGNFDIIVSSLGDSKVELQAYNVMEPSRTYATAVLTSTTPSITLSVWTREFIMEVSCDL